MTQFYISFVRTRHQIIIPLPTFVFEAVVYQLKYKTFNVLYIDNAVLEVICKFLF